MKHQFFSLFAAVMLAALALTGTLLWTAMPVATAPGTPSSPIAPEHSAVITKAVAYMATRVISDGGLNGDPFTSIKGVVALAAAGMPQQTLAHTLTGQTPVDFLRSQAVTYTADASGALLPGRLGMLAVAAVAADANVSNFGGLDVIAGLHSTYQPATGAYSSTAAAGWTTGAASAINQLWALLGLAAAQETVPISATHFLLNLQEADGGWGYGFGGDVDTTALTVQALLTTSNITPTHPAILDAVVFLQQQQDADGAWGYTYGGTYTASADTTASVLQALAALGYTPANTTWAVPGGDPHSALVAMQGADGSFSANALGTAHAIAGLTESPLPIFGRKQRANLALTWAQTQSYASASAETEHNLTVPLPPFLPPSSASVDAVLAFAAAGYDPATVTMTGGSQSVLADLANDTFTYTRDVSGTLYPARAGKLLLGVVAAGAEPTAFGLYPTGHISAGSAINLVAELQATYHPATGAYSSTAVFKDLETHGFAWPFNQSWAMLGLAATGETVPAAAVTFLINQQLDSGDWSGVKDTAIAMQALIAAGQPATATTLVSGTADLKARQNAAGGWYNTQATAYAIQALLAAGEDLLSAPWIVAGHSPFNALRAYQKPDGPCVYNWNEPMPLGNARADNDVATWAAVPALMGVSYPYAGQDLGAFTPVARGLDPDRLVVGELRYAAATHMLELPFGSDWNGDATAYGRWSLIQGHQMPAADAVRFTLEREAGRFVANLVLTQTAGYVLEVFANDHDGIQGPVTQTLLAVADLGASSKSVTPTQAVQDDLVTYTLTLRNTGAVTATNIVMTDTLPWQITFDDWVQPNGALLGTHVITWAGDIAPTAQVDIVFTTKVLLPRETSSLMLAGPVTNTFTYMATNAVRGGGAASFELVVLQQVFLPVVMRK